jgi:hypothetical protein
MARISLVRLHGSSSKGIRTTISQIVNARSIRAGPTVVLTLLTQLNSGTSRCESGWYFVLARNQSEKLICGFKSRFQLEPLISGGVTALGRAWCAGEGYFGY